MTQNTMTPEEQKRRTRRAVRAQVREAMEERRRKAGLRGDIRIFVEPEAECSVPDDLWLIGSMETKRGDAGLAVGPRGVFKLTPGGAFELKEEQVRFVVWALVEEVCGLEMTMADFSQALGIPSRTLQDWYGNGPPVRPWFWFAVRGYMALRHEKAVEAGRTLRAGSGS